MSPRRRPASPKGMPSSPPTGDIAKRLALLRSVADIGSEGEQRGTFARLRQAVDEDRLSDRPRF